MQQALKTEQIEIANSDIVGLLEKHYGDGLVYLPRGSNKQLLTHAIQCGYLNKEGYMTAKGRRLLAKFYRI